MIPLLRPLISPIFRRAFIIAAVAVATGGRTACATGVMLDLSNSRGLQWEVKTPFSDLDGTALAGETLSLDFTWEKANFVRLFTITSSSFAASILLGTNGSGPPSDLQGTGYLVDRYGMAISGFGITGSASGSHLMVLSLYPLWKDVNGTPNENLARPLDFYGVHFDLTFPDLSGPSAQVTWGSFWLSSDPDGEFGVGPRVPADIVPDIGSTLFFLGIGLAGIYGIKVRLFSILR